MARKFPTTSLIILATLIAGLSLVSCGKSSNSSSDATSTQSSPTPPKVGFEADLEYVRKGQYTYVWVFSRKDGKPLDKDDGAYLRTNAHQVVDWVTTDQGKKVIAGTNFDLAEGNLDLLKKRFVVEDYTSK
ncbi:MAG: hypothetical protein H7Z16_15220 [Pyrinomonadaceae bacterium]|nr:hypothetical protein [Pyrinomonadaceae bacterium]